MSLYIVNVAIGADTALPRDQMVNTLHFNGVGTFLVPNTRAQDVADGVADAYTAFENVATIRQVRVRVYDQEEAEPRQVLAEKIKNPGLFPASTQPRELALCLSFYADRNLPRHRGRIFVPKVCINGTPSVRPTTQMMTDVLGLYSRLKDVGGTDLEWSVYSRMDNVHRQIQHGWVDDEWDTIRSRGFRPTTRQTVTAEG